MPLTTAQLTTLRDDIAADPVLGILPHTPDNAFAVAEAYNGEEDPAVVVWKSSVSVDETNEAIVWSEYMAVPVVGGGDIAGLKLAMEQNTTYQRQNAALAQLFRNGDYNPSLQTIRDSLQEIFSGDTNTITAILLLAKRNALKVEALYVSAPVQGASVMAFEGTVAYQDILNAWNIP